MKTFLLVLAIAAMQNPNTFPCDVHPQTFVKTGSTYPGGQCFDVYSHSLPTHRVRIPCAK